MLQGLIQRRGRLLTRCCVHNTRIEQRIVNNTPVLLKHFTSTSNPEKQDEDSDNTAKRSMLQVILENQRKIRQQQAPYEKVLQADPERKAPPSKDPRNGETLFDVFPVPPKVQRKPNSFPEDSFLAYEAVLQDITQKASFRKAHKAKPIPDSMAQAVEQWLTSDVPVVKVDLPSFENALLGGKQPDMMADPCKVAKNEAYKQKERFMETMGFSKGQYRMMSGALFKMANMLARSGNGQPMPVLWEKIKEAGISDEGMMHNILYVAATFPTGQASSKAKRRSKYGHLTGLVSILDVLDSPGSQGADPNEAEDNSLDLVDEIAIYHDLIHKPTEQSLNIRIKLLVSQGKAREADDLIQQIQQQSEVISRLHLRVFRPVLRLHLELGDSASALRLFGKLMELPSVILDAETYMNVLHGLAKNGNFRVNAKPLDGLSGSGFSASGGPKLFDEVAAFMSKEIIDVPDNLAKHLRIGLAESYPEYIVDDSSPLAPLPLAEDRKKDAKVFADRVIIPNDSGRCTLSGVKLRLIKMSDDERRAMIKSLLSLSKVCHENFTKDNKEKRDYEAKSPDEHLQGFYEWLDERQGEPYTTIVDGANVGYYQQNFEEGCFSFHQIAFVVESLLRQGENPLVILPQKYSRPTFTVHQSSDKQTLNADELRIQRSLLRGQFVYFVPSTFLDDLYWILASVSLQSNSRQGRDLTVPPDSSDGRWPGARPVLITNDQMRDHQVELLGPMLFRRWYSNCIVNYNFYPFVKGAQSNDRIGFWPADFFSREIQCNQDDSGTTVWHFPLQGKENEWFCVKLPEKESQ